MPGPTEQRWGISREPIPEEHVPGPEVQGTNLGRCFERLKMRLHHSGRRAKYGNPREFGMGLPNALGRNRNRRHPRLNLVVRWLSVALDRGDDPILDWYDHEARAQHGRLRRVEQVP